VEVRLIGIDCATDAKKTGVARGLLADGHVVIYEARVCTASESAADIVGGWLREGTERRTLLAIDAPLGWPVDLSKALSDHRAGQNLSVEPNLMFRRATDRFVQVTLKKTPLEVGADRIARTAHSALQLISDLRLRTGEHIPLAWSQDWSGVAAIEVYPAATLLAHGVAASGYKLRSDEPNREAIIRNLRARLTLPEDCSAMSESADALDAAVCVLAGGDFVRGQAHPPVDMARAATEGWIWFATGAGSPPASH